MPMYDYRCDRCGTQFEVRQSFSDDRLTVCPEADGPPACTAPGQGPVRKVFTGVGISFKGDGFYKNDHGSNASGRKKEREMAKESSTLASGDSSSSSPDSSSSSSSDSNSSSSSDSNSSNSSSSSDSSNSSSSKSAKSDASRSKSNVSQTAST